LIIQAELVDVSDGSQIWGDRYNRRLSDILEIQDLISGHISEKLRLRLTGEDRKRLTKRYTENTEVYQLYLKGRYYWNKRREEGFKKAIECFNLALAKDPSYALAYAGLADAYVLLAPIGHTSPSEVMPKAKAAAIKALDIDNTLAEAHASLGLARLIHDWDAPAAEAEFKRAIELSPSYATAHHWYALYWLAIGKLEEGIEELKRAQQFDPLSLIINTHLAWAFYFSRQYEQAIAECRKTLDMEVQCRRPRKS
jgi:tetratricopeptide (TPR) repeat protein